MEKKVITETIIKGEFIEIIDNITLNVDKENKLIKLKTSFGRDSLFVMNKKKVNELIKKLSKTLKEIE